MPFDDTSSGAAPTRRRAHGGAGIWNRAVDGLAALGTLMIVLLMIMICCDVVARNVLGSSLPLVSEVGALTLVMIVFLQLGTTVRNDRLARADFFLVMLTTKWPRGAVLMSGLWSLFGMLVCGAIAYSTLGILQRDFAHHEFIGVTGVMTMPTWPFRALILIGAVVATAQFAVQAARVFRGPSTDRDSAP